MKSGYTNYEKKILKTIGGNIREIRKEKGLSQEALAFECSMDRTYIGGIERGERNLAALNIVKICATLKVPPHKIFEGL